MFRNNNVNLDLSSAISSTLLDRDGQGIGFASVQANRMGSAYDFNSIALRPSASSLGLAATQGSNNTFRNALKNALQVGIDAATQPVKGLNWAIKTLDLFLTGEPGAAEPTSLVQEFKPNVTTQFLAVEATAHAGILAFPVNAPNAKVTFDNFKIQAESNTNPSRKAPGLINPNFTNINWSRVAPSPIARSEAQRAFVDGKMYVFGGYTDTTFVPKTKRVDVYNPATNTWKRIGDMPIATTHTGTAVHGRNVYFAGGVVGRNVQKINAVRDVWKFNVDTKKWAAMPKLPAPRGAGELAVLNGKLHFFGGTGLNREVSKGNHWVLSLDNLKKGWNPVASFPNPRNHLADAVIGGKIYAIGGQHGHNQSAVTQRSVHVWDPARPNTWTAVAPLPKPLSHIGGATFVMGDRIIVAGGEIDHGSSIANVMAYSPLSNTWKQLSPLPAPRHSGVAGNIGNRIFYTGGSFKGFKRMTYKGTVTSK